MSKRDEKEFRRMNGHIDLVDWNLLAEEILTEPKQ